MLRLSFFEFYILPVTSCSAQQSFHSPGVEYYHLLLRQKTRIPGVGPLSFVIGIWDLFVHRAGHRGQESYTPTAFEKL